ncbi:MAG: Flp family type IVb pilin [Myxococcota bacterium]
MTHHLGRFWIDERGATAIEYALIASLIFLAILGAVTLFATNAVNMWNSVANHLT